jgi:hypothetical protein
LKEQLLEEKRKKKGNLVEEELSNLSPRAVGEQKRGLLQKEENGAVGRKPSFPAPASAGGTMSYAETTMSYAASSLNVVVVVLLNQCAGTPSWRTSNRTDDEPLAAVRNANSIRIRGCRGTLLLSCQQWTSLKWT